MVSKLGLVVGVLVVTEDEIHFCTQTPEALREGDFVRINGDRVTFAKTIVEHSPAVAVAQCRRITHHAGCVRRHLLSVARKARSIASIFQA